MRISDWSSDVCSSDLTELIGGLLAASDAGIGVVKVEIVNPRDTLERAPAALVDRVRDFGPVESAALVAARFAGEEIAEFGISAEVRRIGCGRQINTLLQPVRRSEEHTSEVPSLMRNSYDVI